MPPEPSTETRRYGPSVRPDERRGRGVRRATAPAREPARSSRRCASNRRAQRRGEVGVGADDRVGIDVLARVDPLAAASRRPPPRARRCSRRCRRVAPSFVGQSRRARGRRACAPRRRIVPCASPHRTSVSRLARGRGAATVAVVGGRASRPPRAGPPRSSAATDLLARRRLVRRRRTGYGARLRGIRTRAARRACRRPRGGASDLVHDLVLEDAAQPRAERALAAVLELGRGRGTPRATPPGRRPTVPTLPRTDAGARAAPWRAASWQMPLEEHGCGRLVATRGRGGRDPRRTARARRARDA